MNQVYFILGGVFIGIGVACGGIHARYCLRLVRATQNRSERVTLGDVFLEVRWLKKWRMVRILARFDEDSAVRLTARRVLQFAGWAILCSLTGMFFIIWGATLTGA